MAKYIVLHYSIANDEQQPSKTVNKTILYYTVQYTSLWLATLVYFLKPLPFLVHVYGTGHYIM